MPAGSKPGERRGGRRKGTANVDKRAIQERVQSALSEKYGKHMANWDPVIAMAIIAADEAEKKDLRLSAAKEVAQYIHPKKKSIEGEIKATHEAGASLLDMIAKATKPGVSAVLRK